MQPEALGPLSLVKHILDAGPLIAARNRNDRYHRWARETLVRLGVPFYSCPEAMAEAAAVTGQPAAIVEMIHNLSVYRRNGRDLIPLVAPPVTVR